MKPKPKISISRQDGAIYLLTSPSGKQYVGQSWDYEKRMANYRRGRCKGQPALYNAIAKHGWDNFAAVALVVGIETQEALDATEKAFIALLCTVSPHGYNLKLGGDGGGECSAETREKLRESQTGKLASQETRDKMSASQKKRYSENPVTRDTRDKISATHKGKVVSVDTRKKLRAANLGNTPHNKGVVGVSAETSKKMSKSAKERKRKPHSKQHCDSISNALTGKTKSTEHVDKMRANAKSQPRKGGRWCKT